MRRGERDLQRPNRLAPNALADAKNSPMHILRAFVFLSFLVQVVLAQEPTPVLPDSKLTPGDAFDVAAEDLCVSGYTKKVRNVPAEIKLEVYAEYAVTFHGPGDYEVDHLIRSSSVAPIQSKISGLSLTGPCLGTPKLKTGWKASFINWFAGATRPQDSSTSDRFKLDRSVQNLRRPGSPTSRLPSPTALEPPLNFDQIWVNTRSGKYWKPNSRYYGKTKQGEYMPEKDAVQKGYRPANGTGE